jgi:hypothetical protein
MAKRKTSFVPSGVLNGRVARLGAEFLVACALTLGTLLTACVPQSPPISSWSVKEPPEPSHVPTPTHTPIASLSTQDWQRYVDPEFGISFDYPMTWSLTESLYPEDAYRALEISEVTLGRILITKEANPEQLSPRQWFEKRRTRYHPDLVHEVGEVEIQGDPSLIIGQPGTCQTVPMLVAFVSRGDAMFVIAHYEEGARPAALEWGRLLETLSFADQPSAATSIPVSYIQFPQAPPNVPCPE